MSYSRLSWNHRTNQSVQKKGIEPMTSTLEIGRQLVSLCREGKSELALETLYDEHIVSEEAEGSDALPARMEGLAAVRGKNEWWYGNHELHETTAEGPFVGPDPDRFAVVFDVDVTFEPTGERQRMSEIGIYTVAGGRIVHEAFWPRRDR